MKITERLLRSIIRSVIKENNQMYVSKPINNLDLKNLSPFDYTWYAIPDSRWENEFAKSCMKETTYNTRILNRHKELVNSFTKRTISDELKEALSPVPSSICTKRGMLSHADEFFCYQTQGSFNVGSNKYEQIWICFVANLGIYTRRPPRDFCNLTQFRDAEDARIKDARDTREDRIKRGIPDPNDPLAKPPTDDYHTVAPNDYDLTYTGDRHPGGSRVKYF